MPDKWTGEIVGKMHNFRITYDEMAATLGCTKAYISMVLNGKRTPANAEQTFRKAVEELIAEKNM